MILDDKIKPRSWHPSLNIHTHTHTGACKKSINRYDDATYRVKQVLKHTDSIVAREPHSIVGKANHFHMFITLLSLKPF